MTTPYKTCDHSGAKVPKTPDEILRDAAPALLEAAKLALEFLETAKPSNYALMAALSQALAEAEGQGIMTCCEDEDNHYSRETDSGLCPKCHEHSNEIACSECGAMVFISECCG